MSRIVFELSRQLRMCAAKKMTDERARQLMKQVEKVHGKALRGYLCSIAATTRLMRLREASNFDSAWELLQQQANRGYCRITRCTYVYEFWNATFFNEILDLSLSALVFGYRPLVCVVNSKGENVWEFFMTQPFLENKKLDEVFTQEQLEKFPVLNQPYGCDLDVGHDVHNEPQRLQYWRQLYSRFFRLDEHTMEYVRCDRDAAVGTKRCCGVLGRGTDYLTLKLAACFRQPTVEQLVEKTHEVLKEQGLSYIYLATEDENIAKGMEKAFPGQILQNKRMYYNHAFEAENVIKMEHVRFDRDNDEYLRGLEYLSSLCILSSCECLVAGRCGGSEFVDKLRKGGWTERFLFDLGHY